MKINEYYYHLQGKDLFVTKKHFHNEIEIIEVLKGNGVVIKDGNSFKLQPGHLYIIDARRPHIVNPTDVNGYMRNKIVIEADSFFRFFAEIGLEGYANELVHTSPILVAENLQVDKLFYKIHKLCTDGGEGEGFAHAYVLELLHICRKNLTKTVYKENDIIQKMLTEINLVDGKITLNELAKKLNYNRYYLCHIFKEKTGITLSHYIDEKKNALCIQELLYTEHSVSAIANNWGFANTASFSRFFKNKNGVSPLKYRKGK